jgi:hypothetical protein
LRFALEKYTNRVVNTAAHNLHGLRKGKFHTPTSVTNFSKSIKSAIVGNKAEFIAAGTALAGLILSAIFCPPLLALFLPLSVALLLLCVNFTLPEFREKTLAETASNIKDKVASGINSLKNVFSDAVKDVMKKHSPSDS